MKIWKHPFTLENLNQTSSQTLLDNLGIEFTEIGDDYLVARMPVDRRTVQPMRILHGGASVCLAETLGSTAAFFCLEDSHKQAPVGLEINANHLRPAREGGFVYGKVSPVRLGRRIQVWNIDIRDEQERLTCVSRITIAVIKRNEGR